MLCVIYYLLTGIIGGFGIYKIIDWDFFIRVVVKSPIVEGFLFWGFLWITLKVLAFKSFRSLKMNLFWVPIILVGITFGLSHWAVGNPLVVALFVKSFSGILYGWLVVKTRSIWPNILVHMLWNSAAIFLFY